MCVCGVFVWCVCVWWGWGVGGLPAPHDLVLKSKVVWNLEISCVPLSGAFQQGRSVPSTNTKSVQ